MKKRATSLMTGGVNMVGSEDAAEADPGATNGDASESVAEVTINNASTRDESKKSTGTIDFLKDDKSEMTYGRRIALNLMKYSWYFPQPKKEGEEKENASEKTEEDPTPRIVDDFDEDISFENADLKKGWAFFEHQTLYRYLPNKNKGEKQSFLKTLLMNKDKLYEKAEPGEDKERSKLYPVTLPHKQLGDFGLGVGLYFSNLRALIFVTLVCGFISMYNILYYASDKYDAENAIEKITYQTFTLAGSAVCSDTEWVPCPNCTCAANSELFSNLALPYTRCANGTNDSGEELRFALKNNCDAITAGIMASNYATVLCMIAGVLIMGYFMKHEEVKFDEDEQTCQDYSVQIKNPPKHAKDPDEWRNYFKEKFGAQVRVCTCAVENDLLVKSLVQRRETMRIIHSLQPGESMEMLDLAKEAADIRRNRTLIHRLRAKVIPGIPEYYDKLVSLKGLVEGLAQLEYDVTKVFVTFETEEDQRKVLGTLSVGYTNAKSNNKEALPDETYLFQEKHVLDVCEPEEPNTIRWQDLNAFFILRLKQQAWTFVYTFVMLIVVFFIVYFVNKESLVGATYTISLFNSLFPLVAKAMTDYLETHQTESQYQSSLYIKLVFFRWTTSVLIFFIITPFTETITYGENGLLDRINAQFIADLTTTNGLALLDIAGHLKRHFLAPRAKTQDKMNILFQGTDYDIAERYTDMTKILFMCVVYSAIYPMSFFLCAISLTLKYFVDRFTLLRSWKRASAIGRSISSISRNYFITISIIVMVINASYFWTGFPFDNLCEVENSTGISNSLFGNFTVKENAAMLDGLEISTDVLGTDVIEFNTNREFSTKSKIAIVEEGTLEYRVCSQNFLGNFPQVSFPFVPSAANGVDNLNPEDYMSEGQLFFTPYYGWVAFGLVILIMMKFCWMFYREYKRVYKGGYKPVGESQKTPYSKVKTKDAFIPQVRSTTFAFPLIACKIDNIDEAFFGFNDPSRSYAYYDLTKDANKLIGAEKAEKEMRTFTVVKSWPVESENTDEPVESEKREE